MEIKKLLLVLETVHFVASDCIHRIEQTRGFCCQTQQNATCRGDRMIIRVIKGVKILKMVSLVHMITATVQKVGLWRAVDV